ncbi:hypothetical protein [Erwinia psidii]|uniref:hypothetical protein n=1 Tax=Erwinia psidii TaxID=69224 RepID=UPI00226B585E|nr:hypothetical protein [Erwinia psidii]
MMILRAMALLLLLISTSSYSFEKCIQRTNCDNTTLGRLEYVDGGKEKDKQSRIFLNGNEIFKNDSYRIGADIEGWTLDKKNYRSKIIVFYDFNTPQYIKTDPTYGDLYRYRAYRLFNFSGKEVVISNEFYPPADYKAPLRWVSWGQKNSVIAFDDGSRFRYENGHVTMIDDGTKSGNDN